MRRWKLGVGAVLLVVMTMFATLGGVLYVFRLSAEDGLQALRFFRAFKAVQAQYVEGIDTQRLISGAIRGMVGSLEDPHSVYMDEKLYNEFKVETSGAFGGVGIVVGMKDKHLIVVSPIEGTPGEKAGIKSGDRIVRIDGAETKNMPLDEAVGKIRGPEGSQITLSIERGESEVIDFALTRSIIDIKTVGGKMLDEQTGYIRITTFNEHTGADFLKKYQELEELGMKRLVLDLRNNPGGIVEESVKVAGRLVPKGPVVSMVTRNGKKETRNSNLETPPIPLAVLVNGGSASASEIVAGAVQDTHAGTLVGTKTFGKGSVQTIFRLSDGAIKLTIAKYFTPAERSINGVGIEPDIVVEGNGERRGEIGADAQLDKALEILRDK